MLPRDVECPRCGAAINRGCRTNSLSGVYAAKTHLVRWRAIGVAKPTLDDFHRDYEDGRRRDLEITQRLSDKIRNGSL